MYILWTLSIFQVFQTTSKKATATGTLWLLFSYTFLGTYKQCKKMTSVKLYLSLTERVHRHTNKFHLENTKYLEVYMILHRVDLESDCELWHKQNIKKMCVHPDCNVKNRQPILKKYMYFVFCIRKNFRKNFLSNISTFESGYSYE